MATTEIVLNEYIAAELRTKYTGWGKPEVVNAEKTGVFKATGKRPDIVISDNPASPVCIETEFFPATSVEADAIARIGQNYAPTGGRITSVLAVRIPARYTSITTGEIASSLKVETELEYCILFGESSTESHRWPASGFIRGTIDDLAHAVAGAAISPLVIEQGAQVLEDGAKALAAIFSAAKASHTAFSTRIADCLKQDDSEQTLRMAATIMINAFVFQETLVGDDGPLAGLNSTYDHFPATKLEVTGEWTKILAVNYWPIFGIARQLVALIPMSIWQAVFEQAFSTADRLLSLNLGKNPDLVGTIFQRLISDRRFLATFYTAPSSAALMCRLLIGAERPGGGDWSDVAQVGELKIADFACGTGSLLCAAYGEVRTRLENAGVDSAAMHKAMIEDVLVGCDVLPSATHITASQLSSAHPLVRYEQTKILTLPFGAVDGGGVALGAFDLLDTQAAMSTIATHATGIGSTDEGEVDAWQALGGASVNDQSFDLIVMNPPFTRLTGGGGKTDAVSRPLFAAFGTDDATQNQMSKKFSKLFENSAYHGNAGAGSAFVEVGHRKLKDGGSIGLILHLSALSGSSWQSCRDLWRNNYCDVIALSITGGSSGETAFSADTGVGECMVIGTRSKSPDYRMTGVSLTHRPRSILEGAEIARIVGNLRTSGKLASIEDGPIGGTSIYIGNEKVGEAMSAPTPESGPWPLFRIADHALAQTAYQMVELSKCWLPGVAPTDVLDAVFCKLGEIGDPGPYHLDISAAPASGGAPRGPFELRSTTTPETSTFPVLKAHDEKRERFLEIATDAEGVARTSGDPAVASLLESRRNAIWSTRTRLHFVADLQFNSNALPACLTDRPSLGGRAWPSFKLTDPRYEKLVALWFNSTLGVLAYWWIANKAQSGRGSVTTSRLASLTCIDPRAFSDAELLEINTFFDANKILPLMDIHECAQDSNRAAIDEFVIEKMLKPKGNLKEQLDAMQLVRAKLAIEPTIRGGR